MTTKVRPPTPRQRAILAYCAQMGGQAGLLGVDQRSYGACLRRGWVREAEVDRDFGLGPGIVMQLTPEGRRALEGER